MPFKGLKEWEPQVIHIPINLDSPYKTGNVLCSHCCKLREISDSFLHITIKSEQSEYQNPPVT